MSEQAKKRQRKTIDPCPRCGLNRALCLCPLIPLLNLKTRVSLVIHAKELKRTTNTGRLALAALSNGEMIVRGEILKPVDLTNFLSPGYRPLLFFPSVDAVELTTEFVESYLKGSESAIQLFVPDGNWRQASKVHTRHPEIRDVPRVKISEPNLARHHLRTEHLPEGMSTLEAIAKAISVLEGKEAGALLSELYQEKLARTLFGRGQ